MFLIKFEDRPNSQNYLVGLNSTELYNSNRTSALFPLNSLLNRPIIENSMKQ